MCAQNHDSGNSKQDHASRKGGAQHTNSVDQSTVCELSDDDSPAFSQDFVAESVEESTITLLSAGHANDSLARQEATAIESVYLDEVMREVGEVSEIQGEIQRYDQKAR